MEDMMQKIIESTPGALLSYVWHNNLIANPKGIAVLAGSIVYAYYTGCIKLP